MEDLHPSHSFKWRKKGDTALGFCAWHTDKKTRSLSIYKDAKGKIRFKCFACGAHGADIEAVILSNKGMGRDAANRWLISHGYAAETEIEAKERARNEVYMEFYKWSNDMLINDPRAAGLRAYIASRHVRSTLLPSAPIGYYPPVEDVEVWLAQHNVPEAIAEELVPPAHTKHIAEGSIAFFYRSAYDQFSRLKLRNVLSEKKDDKEKAVVYLGGHKAKDRNGFFSASMDGLYTDNAIVVEGEFDALALFSTCRDYDPECIEPIYCFGSGGTMDKGMELLANMGVENQYTFPDNDGPGIDYAFGIAENHPHSFIIMPEDYADGDDPASWAGNHSFDDLQKAYRTRIPAFAWIGKRLAEEVQGGTLEEQSHAKEKVITYAKKLTPTNRELFLKAYAPITGASYDSLCEEVQNNDRIRYRKILTAEGFGIQMNIPLKRGEVIWEPISNVIIENDSDLIMDDGSGTTVRHFVLRLLMQHKEVTVTISAGDYNDDKRFSAFLLDQLGSDMWIRPKHLMYVKEAAAILPKSGRAKAEELVYTHTGWREGKFLMPNGYIDEEGFHDLDNVSVELPPNPSMFTRYKTAEPPADMSIIRQVIKDDVLKVFPYHVTLPAIAHMFLGPLMPFLPAEVKPYCLWVQGLTGSFKTSYVSLLNCLWGDFRSGDFETWRSTVNAIEKNGYFLKDVSYVVDDFKKVDCTDRSVTTLMQNYADRHGRSRMRSDGTNQKTWHIRGTLTVTAEDVPSGEASVLARTLLIQVKGCGDSDRLTRAQMHAKHLPGVMAKYIQFLAGKRFKEDYFFNLIREKQAALPKSHARIKENFATNAVAWELFAEFMGLQELTDQYHEVMLDVFKNMDSTTKSEQAGAMFVDMVSELLSSGDFYLEGIKGADDTRHDEHAKRLGWVCPDYVYLLGSVTLAEANSLRQRLTGSPIKYSAAAIYDQMISARQLIPQGDKPSHVIKVDNSSIRVLKFNRGVIEQSEETYYDAQPTGSEVRVEENGALLN